MDFTTQSTSEFVAKIKEAQRKNEKSKRQHHDVRHSKRLPSHDNIHN
ncbi:DUF4023 family protein [Brevibacillus sp. SYSU BS000544]